MQKNKDYLPALLCAVMILYFMVLLVALLKEKF